MAGVQRRRTKQGRRVSVPTQLDHPEYQQTEKDEISTDDTNARMRRSLMHCPV